LTSRTSTVAIAPLIVGVLECCIFALALIQLALCIPAAP
jgi:hypothetical protein